MAEKVKLSDEDIEKVTGGVDTLYDSKCPECGADVYLKPSGTLYCSKCKWYENQYT